MRRLMSAMILAVVAGATNQAAADWVSLFNGKDLSGWKAYGDGKFEVKDGAIICQGTKQKHGWLVSSKEYSNFILKLRFQWVRGNTGIQFRSALDGETMVGYQADLDLSNEVTTGTLHEQGGRRMLQKTLVDGRTICDVSGWNEYEIFAVGDRIQLFLNGIKTADFRDSRAAKGIFAFQAHENQDNLIRYKDIRVLELDAGAAYRRLFNGKDLTGWRPVGEETWSVANGGIVGKSGPKKGYGWLVPDGQYLNFTLKFRWRWHGGNSGVQFRSRLVGEQMHGYQADIDPSVPTFTGMLYDEHGAGKVAVPPESFDSQVLKKKDWNTYEISAIGKHVVLYVNGVKSIEIPNAREKKGIFALQVHSGGPVHMAWKDLEILELGQR